MAKVVIGGVAFASKEAAQKYTSSLLRSYTLGQIVTPEHFSFLHALLRDRHPQAAQKIGAGVRLMSVRREPGGRGNCFWLERVDGTVTDWGTTECFKPKTTPIAITQAADFREACRVAVVDQVLAHKQGWFALLPGARCSRSGVPMTYNTVEIHHDPSFADLVDRFVAETRLDLARVVLLGHGDGESALRIADDALRAQWQAFHRQHAKMYVLDKAAHREETRSKQQKRIGT